jgi:hypothetical protein
MLPSAGSSESKRERSMSLELTGVRLPSVVESQAASPYFPAFNPNEDEDDIPPVKPTRASSAFSGSSRRGELAQERMKAQADWLKSEIIKRPGFQDFKDARNQPVSNAAVAKSWDFATKFEQDYADTMEGVCSFHSCISVYSSHLQGFRMGKIKKQAVQMALGIKSTWMSSARKGARLVRTYGEGGSRENADVVNELARDTKDGAGALLKFFETKGLS